MPAFAFAVEPKASTPKPADWYRNWKNRYKAGNPDVVAQMAATGIWESANCFFAIVSVRRPAEQLVSLMSKLNDPALDDSPYKPAAVSRSYNLDVEIRTALASAAASEQYASLIWQDFDPAERAANGLANAWEIDPHAEDLIGQGLRAWRAGANWPAAFHPITCLRNVLPLPLFYAWAERGVIEKG
ncbi:MAG: hypothetical protein ACR2OE_04120 [Thermomicrobiales bacterium]